MKNMTVAATIARGTIHYVSPESVITCAPICW